MSRDQPSHREHHQQPLTHRPASRHTPPLGPLSALLVLFLLITVIPSTLWAAPAVPTTYPTLSGSSDADAGSRPPVLGRDLMLPMAPALGPLKLANPEMLGMQRDLKVFFESLRQAQADPTTPSEARDEVLAINGGPLSEAQLAELEGFRSQLGLLLTATRLYSQGHRQDPMRLFITHQQVRAAIPEELYLIRDRLLIETDWARLSMHLGRPQLQTLRPLAEYGPLSSEDQKELEAFRGELIEFLAEARRLPEGARRDHRLSATAWDPERVATLPLESLFLLRRQLGPGKLGQARREAQAIERIETLDATGHAELEGLRADMLETFLPTAADTTAAEQLSASISQMRTEHLALAEATLAEIPAWQSTLPALQAAGRSEALHRELEALQAGDPTTTQELEGFRVTMARQYDGLVIPPEIDPGLAREASEFLDQAPPELLAVYRHALDQAPDTAPADFGTQLALATRALDPVSLGGIGQWNASCGIDLGVVDVNPCVYIAGAVNDIIVNPINSVIGLIEDGINAGIEGINAVESALGSAIDAVESALGDAITGIEDAFSSITDLFDSIDFDSIIDSLIDVAMDVAKGALEAVGDLIQTMDQVLGQAVGVLREFVDEVKQPFISLVESAGDGQQSELLTQLDGFMFNDDEADGPLGLVTCMERALCVEEELVSFEVILPGETEPTIQQERLCTKGLTIPLIGEVGSDRSVFACMVIKSEVGYIKDLLPEDSLPGGKVADIVLSSFVHKLDQLCYVNDWMAGNRQLVEERVATATRDERFEKLLGSCTLVGTELSCPDLLPGQSIAGMMGGLATQVGNLQSGVDGVQTGVQAVQATVIGVQATVDGVQTDVAGVQAAVNGVQAGVQGIQTGVQGVQATAEGIQGSVNGVQTGVQGVQASVDGIQATADGIQGSVDDVQGSVDDVQSSVDTVSADLDGGFADLEDLIDGLGGQVGGGNDDLAEQLEEFQLIDLQVSIEANLATTAFDNDTANSVSLFLLPESVGGMLEVSVDLVISIIQRAGAAGLQTHEATRFLTVAQIAIAGGEYKRGYLNLARAYNAVMALTPVGP